MMVPKPLLEKPYATQRFQGKSTVSIWMIFKDIGYALIQLKIFGMTIFWSSSFIMLKCGSFIALLMAPEMGGPTPSIPYHGDERYVLPTWMMDFYGIHVGKQKPSHMDPHFVGPQSHQLSVRVVTTPPGFPVNVRPIIVGGGTQTFQNKWWWSIYFNLIGKQEKMESQHVARWFLVACCLLFLWSLFCYWVVFVWEAFPWAFVAFLRINLRVVPLCKANHT